MRTQYVHKPYDDVNTVLVTTFHRNGSVTESARSGAMHRIPHADGIKNADVLRATARYLARQQRAAA